MIKKYKVHIIWAIVAVIALVGGVVYGKISGGASGTAGSFGSSSTRGTFAGKGTASSGGFTFGQVSAIDGSSITLQLANGNSEVVFYSASTVITEPTNVPASSIKAGTNIQVSGTQNSDGSLTATAIQIRTGNMPGTPGNASSGTKASGQ